MRRLPSTAKFALDEATRSAPVSADIHGDGPKRHLADWRPYGSYTSAYGEKRRRYRCRVCDRTRVEGNFNRPGPRPKAERKPFYRFWEELELQFVHMGLPRAIERACIVAGVSRRTVAKWLKAQQFPGGPPRFWAQTPRRHLLVACLDVGRLKVESRPHRPWNLDAYEGLRDDLSWPGAPSMLYAGITVWEALLIARSAVSIAQGRAVAPWMSLAPEISEPWLTMLRGFQPRGRGSAAAVAGALGESGLRYIIRMTGDRVDVLVGTRRRSLLYVRRWFEVDAQLDFRCYLPLLPARAEKEGESLRIPVAGARGRSTAPYFEVPISRAAALARTASN